MWIPLVWMGFGNDYSYFYKLLMDVSVCVEKSQALDLCAGRGVGAGGRVPGGDRPKRRISSVEGLSVAEQQLMERIMVLDMDQNMGDGCFGPRTPVPRRATHSNV